VKRELQRGENTGGEMKNVDGGYSMRVTLSSDPFCLKSTGGGKK